MPAIGRTNTSSTNIITVTDLPTLPYPMFKGKVTWSDTFDSKPTGSIEYEGIAEEEIATVERAYKLGTLVKLYGIAFKVSRFAFDRTQINGDIEGQNLNFFKVAVTLETAVKEKDIKEKTKQQAEMFGYLSYAQGGKYLLLSGSTRTNFTLQGGRTFDENEINTDGQNYISLETEGYNGAELTGGFSDNNSDTVPETSATVFTLKEPLLKETIEEDDFPTQPYENTKVLRDDTGSNFDESGPKKVYKSALKLYDKPEQDTIVTYGFAYLYQDLDQGHGVYYNDEPKKFWIPVEKQVTSYIYKRTNPVLLNVTITAPGVDGPTEAPGAFSGERSLRLIVHPDYLDLCVVTLGGNGFTVRSRAEFQVEAVTQGWKLERLKKEDPNRSTVDKRDPYYTSGAWFFRKVPFYSRTIYTLKSAQGLFGEKVEPPFRIEWADYKTLEPRVKKYFDTTQTTKDGKVAIIYPDPNYVEKLYIQREVTAANSFEWMIDPDPSQFPDPDKHIQGTNRPLPAPRLKTGQESRNETSRILLTADHFVEKTTEYSSQDPGFDNSIERIQFKDMAGKPPEPNYRLAQYEEKKGLTNAQPQGAAKQTYFVYTDNFPDFAAGGSVSFPNAKSLSEAIAALQTQLRKSSMQASQCAINVQWFYPEMRAGVPLSVAGYRFSTVKGLWRIMQVGWTLEYQGKNTPVGLLVTTPGTAITLGLDKARGVSVRQKTNPASGGSADASGSPVVTVSAAATLEPQAVLPAEMQNRRNF